MKKLSIIETAALSFVASSLNIPAQWLDDLITAESGWDPMAANPKSSAKGLIQFIDTTAQSIGYKSSADLVEKNPTITSQLKGPVLDYLKKYAPFATRQALFMAVFYPAARNNDPFWIFPEMVRAYNPGIDTIQDYMDFVDDQVKKKKELPRP